MLGRLRQLDLLISTFFLEFVDLLAKCIDDSSKISDALSQRVDLDICFGVSLDEVLEVCARLNLSSNNFSNPATLFIDNAVVLALLAGKPFSHLIDLVLALPDSFNVVCNLRVSLTNILLKTADIILGILLLIFEGGDTVFTFLESTSEVVRMLLLRT